MRECRTSPIDVFFSAMSTLGAVASKLHGVEKNVVDDVVLEIIEKTSNKKIDSEEFKKTLDGLMVNKVHVPGYKKVKIRYEVD